MSQQSQSGSRLASPEMAWKLAVDITSRVGADEAKAINVLLYLTLVVGSGGTVWNRLKARAKFVGRLRFPGKKRVPGAPRGRPLFAFLYDTGANTNNLMPVYRAAQKRGWQVNVLGGREINLDRMDIKGPGSAVSVNELMKFITPQEWWGAWASSRDQFAAVLAAFQREAPEHAGLIARDRDLILTELAAGMIAARGLRRLYETWEPSLIVSTSNMWPFDQAMYMEARRARIPSFVIQHGITNRYWWPFDADKMLLWGDAFQEELLKLGTPANRLAICGMPAADNLFVRHGKKPGAPAHKAAVSYVVLSDTQARSLEPELYDRYKKLFTALVAATPQIQWSIKLHPLENEEFYRELLDGRFPNFRILPKSTTLEEAVTQADVACTMWSTSGLEAMIMRRPLVVWDVHSVIYQYAWWPKCGGGIYLNTVEAMVDFVKQSAAGGQFLADLLARQDEFLTHNFAHPGRAAEAALDLMENEIGQCTRPSGNKDHRQAQPPEDLSGVKIKRSGGVGSEPPLDQSLAELPGIKNSKFGNGLFAETQRLF